MPGSARRRKPSRNGFQRGVVGRREAAGGRGLSLDLPRLQQEKLPAEVRAVVAPPPNLVEQQPQAVGDKPILFDEDNKAGIKADELGEQHRQARGTACTSQTWLEIDSTCGP